MSENKGKSETPEGGEVSSIKLSSSVPAKFEIAGPLTVLAISASTGPHTETVKLFRRAIGDYALGHFCTQGNTKTKFFCPSLVIPTNNLLVVSVSGETCIELELEDKKPKEPTGMKLAEALRIMANHEKRIKEHGYRISYERRVGGLLYSEVFPDHDEEPILDLEQARELRRRFEAAGGDTYVNVRVVDLRYNPVVVPKE